MCNKDNKETEAFCSKMCFKYVFQKGDSMEKMITDQINTALSDNNFNNKFNNKIILTTEFVLKNETNLEQALKKCDGVILFSPKNPFSDSIITHFYRERYSSTIERWRMN